MKRFLLFFLSASLALAQTNVQKNPQSDNVISNGPIKVGSGNAITIKSGGSLIAEAGATITGFPGVGTVTSIGLTGANIFTITGSPVTTTGTINLALATQLANRVLAGPTSGSAGVPTFRVLVAADVPTLPYASPFIVPATAWVETTGSDVSGAIGRQDLPFATFAAAYAALPSNGGTLRFGVGTFAPLGSQLSKDNVTIIGAERPNFASDVLSLTGGTIIKGPLIYRANNLQFRNLGVDSGTTVCNALYSGTAQEGLVCSVTYIGSDPQFYRLVVDNVICLAKNYNAAVHPFACEGYSFASINNVETYFGFTGQAYKVQYSTVSNIRSQNNSTAGITLKSDTIRQCKYTTFTNLVVDGLSAGLYGILLQCDSNASGNYQELNNVAITNAVVRNVASGFVVIGNTTTARDLIRDCTFTNIQANTCSAYGIQVYGYTNRLTFVNCSASSSTTNGYLTSAIGNLIKFLGCSSTNSGGDGFKLVGATDELSNCTATDNGGYGFLVDTSATAYESNNGGSGNSSGLFGGAGTWLEHDAKGTISALNGIEAARTIRVTGAFTPASGSGLEFQYGAIANTASIASYNHTGAAYRAMLIDGLTLGLNTGSGGAVSIGGNTVVTGTLRASGVFTLGSGPTTVSDAAGKILSTALDTVGAAQGGTGNTSYAKGDILVATGATTLAKLPVGADGTVLTADAAQTTGLKYSAVTGTGTVTTIPDGSTNGVTWVVANRTTTPTFTFSLGAISPTSISTGSVMTSTVTGTSLTITGLGTGMVKATADAFGLGAAGTDYVIPSGSVATLTTGRTFALTGDVTGTSGSFNGSANATTATTLATVNGNVGTFGSATQASVVTLNAKGLVTAGSNVTITPAIGSVTGLGSGVGAALAIDVGSVGGPVVFNGAGGAPSSLTIPSGATATTQSAANNSTAVSTTAYADRAARATNLGTFASPNTAAGAITWVSPVYNIYTSAGSTRTYALPAASSYGGQAFILNVAVGTGHVNVQPASGASLVLAGVLLTADHYVQAATSAPGNYICFISDGTNWNSLGSSGTWADAASP